MFEKLAQYCYREPVVDTLHPDQPVPLVGACSQLVAWHVQHHALWDKKHVIARALFGVAVDAFVRGTGVDPRHVLDGSFLHRSVGASLGEDTTIYTISRHVRDRQHNLDAVADLLAPIFAAGTNRPVRQARQVLCRIGDGIKEPEWKRDLLSSFVTHSHRIGYLLTYHPTLLTRCEQELRRTLNAHGRDVPTTRPIVAYVLAYRLSPVVCRPPYVRQPFLLLDDQERVQKWCGIEYEGLRRYLIAVVESELRRVREHEDPSGLVKIGHQFLSAKPKARRTRGGGPDGPGGDDPPSCPRETEFHTLGADSGLTLPKDFKAHLIGCQACVDRFVHASILADDPAVLCLPDEDSERDWDLRGSFPPVELGKVQVSIPSEAPARCAPCFGEPGVDERSTQSLLERVRSLWSGSVGWGALAATGAAALGVSVALKSELSSSKPMPSSPARADIEHAVVLPGPEARDRPACGVVSPELDYAALASVVPVVQRVGGHGNELLSEAETVDRIATSTPGLSLVLGGAGSGKSTLARHLAQATCSRPGTYVSYLHPAALSEVGYKALPDLLYEQDFSGTSLTREELASLLGRVPGLLVFDGFDELADEAMVALRDRIQGLQREYPNLSLVVLSRPLPSTGPTLGFTDSVVEDRTFHILPLSAAHVLHLAGHKYGIGADAFAAFLDRAGVGERDRSGSAYLYLDSLRAVRAMATLCGSSHGAKVTRGQAFTALLESTVVADGAPERGACLRRLLHHLSRTTPIRVTRARCEQAASRLQGSCGDPARTCRSLLTSNLFAHDGGVFRPITPALEVHLAATYGRHCPD